MSLTDSTPLLPDLDPDDGVWTNDYFAKIQDIRSLILASKRNFPDRVFLLTAEKELAALTYLDLFNFCDKFEKFLDDQNVEEQAAVAYVFHNSSLLVLFFLATLYARRIFVPINPSCSLNEIDYILSDVKPILFLYDGKLKNKLVNISHTSLVHYEIPHHKQFIDDIFSYKSVIDIDKENGFTKPLFFPDNVAQIIYTSGTTGNPKGVVLTHKNILANSFAMGKLFKYSSDDRFLTVTPLFHNSGQMFTTMMPLWCGATTTAVRSDLGLINFRFYVEEFEINWTFGMPSHVFFLLEQAASPIASTLKGFQIGGAKLPPETKTSFEECFGVPIYCNYGLTETFSVVATEHPNENGRCIGSVGKPLEIMDT
ncbi:MAG: AMP-binding protein, partial [Halioglobus sp.]|nr:AMP-binding protein [Halioglobus sp.]